MGSQDLKQDLLSDEPVFLASNDEDICTHSGVLFGGRGGYSSRPKDSWVPWIVTSLSGHTW